MTGILYAVPSLLGAGDPADVLPARTLAIARGIEHWIVETPKAARAFLKAIGHPKPIASLAIHALPERPTRAELEALLAPAREGFDVGLVSDAGAPGVADPGATIVAAAHQAGVRVVPLVGPSSILLALMAFGCSGQAFAFHGYLPVAPAERAGRLRALEAESTRLARTQLFIETPYRNEAMIRACADALAPATRVGVAVDLTLATESVVVLPAAAWRTRDAAAYAKRPAIFALQA